MTLYETDPLVDPRWLDLVIHHTSASVFHTPGWLRALQQTYGCEPVVFSASPPSGTLYGASLFCRVRKPLSGTCLISLPFSDHCEPLGKDADDTADLLGFLNRSNGHPGHYTEIRPVSWHPEMQVLTGFFPSRRYYLHVIDLQPELNTIFDRMHKDCIQRKIRRAEREGVEYREGISEALLQDFFRLFVDTRRRHGVPPQPWSWFINLCSCMESALKVRMAYKDGCAIAGMMTLSHRTTLVYKYGCSDKGAANLGAMPLLFWEAIQDAKRQGMKAFDLGRSDFDAAGLIAFKERLGATRQVLTYATFPKIAPRRTWPQVLAKSLFRHLPNPLLAGAGSVVYRYIV